MDSEPAGRPKAPDCELRARWLPDGRFELSLGRGTPVIVRPATFFSKTPGELFCLTGLLTIMADYFRNQHGYALPLETGVFTETGDEFVLAEATGSSCSDKNAVLRALAFQERW